jgi:hypothetical protein
MSELYDKLPLIVQVAIALAMAFAASIVWALGRRSTAGENAEEQEWLETIRQLQEKLLEERFARLEADLRVVVAASRLGVENEMHQSIGELHGKIADMSARIDRLLSIRLHRD